MERLRDLYRSLAIVQCHECHVSRVRYAVYVTALGHVFHLLWGTEEIEDWIFGLMGALGLELVLWEIVGNSDLVHNKIRDTQAADTSYENTLGNVKNFYWYEC